LLGIGLRTALRGRGLEKGMRRKVEDNEHQHLPVSAFISPVDRRAPIPILRRGLVGVLRKTTRVKGNLILKLLSNLKTNPKRISRRK